MKIAVHCALLFLQEVRAWQRFHLAKEQGALKNELHPNDIHKLPFNEPVLAVLPCYGKGQTLLIAYFRFSLTNIVSFT